MAGWENGHMLKLTLHLPRHNIRLADAVYLITKELYANAVITGVGWDNLKCVATNPEGTTIKIHIVTLVLDIN